MQIATSSREALISRARQTVLAGGPLCGDVPSWIQSSWQRCLARGFVPDQPVGFDVISSAQMRRSREANRLLAQAALPTLHTLAQTIAPTRYFAILTNAQGVVVASSGEIDRADRRATLITREGVDLSEQAVGTTAIGSTLVQQHDVWLHRGEHFFADTGAYSCAGSPIFGQQGQCVGMLDVTGIEVPERPELMHLVSSAARRIENKLVLAAPHTLVLHLRWPGAEVASRESEGLLCVDEDGNVQAMNSTARQMLGQLPSTHTADALHLSELFATEFARLLDSRLVSEPLTVPLWSGLQVQVRSSRSGKYAPKTSPTAVDTRVSKQVGALKAHEVDVIRDTVAQLKGNVAASAKKLGISRATVYRKLQAPSKAPIKAAKPR
jgi:sigma-54 dependent transcriptional regulator, acetoin dehydrogenase operon transcriptional activator AcoR